MSDRSMHGAGDKQGDTDIAFVSRSTVASNQQHTEVRRECSPITRFGEVAADRCAFETVDSSSTGAPNRATQVARPLRMNITML